MHAGIALGIALTFTIAPSFQARDDSLRLLHRPAHAEAGRCMDLPDTVKAGTSRMSELAIGTPPGRTRRIRVEQDSKGHPARLIEMSIELERDKPFAIHLVGVTFAAGKPVRSSSAHTIERGSSTTGERRTQHIRLTDDELEAAKALAIWVLLRCPSATSR
jgi:hypothetical protein